MDPSRNNQDSAVLLHKILFVKTSNVFGEMLIVGTELEYTSFKLIPYWLKEDINVAQAVYTAIIN